MSIELLQINLNRETNFDFELTISGISANDAKVRFGLDLPGYTIQIPCTRGDDTTWSVTVPILEGIVEEGHYGFSIELIINGYHFAPVKGTAQLAPVAEVTGTVPRKSVEVSVTSINPKDENEKPKVKKKTKKKVEPKKEEVKEEEEKEESIVDKLIGRRFKPFETGKSLISQMIDRAEKEENLSKQEKSLKQFLKD